MEFHMNCLFLGFPFFFFNALLPSFGERIRTSFRDLRVHRDRGVYEDFWFLPAFTFSNLVSIFKVCWIVFGFSKTFLVFSLRFSELLYSLSFPRSFFGFSLWSFQYFFQAPFFEFLQIYVFLPSVYSTLLLIFLNFSSQSAFSFIQAFSISHV